MDMSESNLLTESRSRNRQRPIVPVNPPPNALRDLRRLSRELDQPFTDTVTMVLMLGLERIRVNWGHLRSEVAR
jgi:hypothetical protein